VPISLENQPDTGAEEEVIIEISHMHKWFADFHVLKDINLTVHRKERVVICGPSGSGKSTLIRCINRLEEHQRGQIRVDGVELTNDLKNIEKIRAEVGMVFQHFNLFPHLTILENLTLGPIWVRKEPKARAEETAMALLEKVRIAEQARKYPGQLSGGQQQRVAVARAIATSPRVLFADEPTGNLDSKVSREVLELISELNRSQGITVVMVTHEAEMADYARRIVTIRDGLIASDIRRDTRRAGMEVA
jgi:general L-amino acid transport system ATP-binding protein